MFDFEEELKYYQKCLETEQPGEALSGEETKDILDILRIMGASRASEGGKEES